MLIASILQLSMANTEQHELVAGALSKVAPLLPVYTVIEDVYFNKRDASLKNEFESAIVDLYTQILIFQIQIVKFYQKHGPERLIQSVLQPVDWEGWNTKIQGADSKCQRMMQTFDAQDSDKKHQETVQSLKRIETNVKKILERQEGETNSDILEWLCPLNPIDEHEFFLEKTGTQDKFSERGSWLFRSDEYKSWVNPTAPEDSVLWIQGSMGTGKTAVTTLIVERELERRGFNSEESVAFFYCNAKSSDRIGSDPILTLRGLLRQMAWSTDDGSPIRAVKDVFDDKSHGGTRPEYLSFNRCTRLLGEVVSGLKQMTIIIDALDESSDPATILGALETLVTENKSAVSFRLCLVSKRDVKVKDFFSQCRIFDVDLTDRAEDMEYYVRDCIRNRKPRLLRGTMPDLEKDVIRSLCENSHGM